MLGQKVLDCFVAALSLASGWIQDLVLLSLFFFFNDTATTEIYTLSLHDALPICRGRRLLEQPRARGRDALRLLPPQAGAVLLPGRRDRPDALAQRGAAGGERGYPRRGWGPLPPDHGRRHDRGREGRAGVQAPPHLDGGGERHLGASGGAGGSRARQGRGHLDPLAVAIVETASQRS